jgi:hypothetical protein
VGILCSGIEWAVACLKIFQVLGHNIRPDFGPLDNVASVLGMATRRARAGPFIKPLVGLLRCQGKASNAPEKRMRGFHG